MSIVEGKLSLIALSLLLITAFIMFTSVILSNFPDKGELYSITGYVNDIDYVGVRLGGQNTIYTFNDGRVFKLEGFIFDVPRWHTVTIYYYKDYGGYNNLFTSVEVHDAS